MRTQHPNLWHPIRFAIMLIVLAWTIYGVCYEPPTDIFGVIWVAMLVTALVPVSYTHLTLPTNSLV